MPEKQEHRTKINGRVRIKDTVTDFYPKARVYNEGVVRRQLHDEYGYPLIWVEWDKDHWAYSGEDDGLVLEAHFDPVEESMAEDNRNNDLAEALGKFLEGWKGGVDKEEKDERPVEEMSYEDVLNKGQSDARKGEAFIMIVASAETFQGSELIVPHIYMHSKSDDAALVLDATAADYSAQAMTRLVQEIARDRRDGSSSS